MDKHMDRFHAAEVDPSASACLADLCDILHCDWFAAAQRGGTDALQRAPCHTTSMQRTRERCQDVAHQCFPPHFGGAAEALHAFMHSSFCQAATCRHSRCAAPLPCLPCRQAVHLPQLWLTDP